MHHDDDDIRDCNASHYSSSDDGGFIDRHTKSINRNPRASWRRPLVASTSQLSLHSNHSTRSFLQSIGGLLRAGARYQNLATSNNIYKNLPLPVHSSRPLHINTVSGHQLSHHLHQITPNLYTPSRVSRIFSSSPSSTLGLTSPWSTAHNFSDLSTVYPGSAERSFPTPSSGFNRFRYNGELPSLRTIQEENRRLNNGFVPLNLPSPSWRGYYHNPAPYHHSYRPRTRWYPRNRFGRNNVELLSPLPHLNLSLRPGMSSALEASPESRSSSSGFCSKNTSNHHQGSHHSGSTSEWRMLPPYRPPPPPPSSTYHPHYSGHYGLYNIPPQMPQLKSLHSYYPMNYPHYNNHRTTSAPSYTMGNWLDMISRLNAATEHQVNLKNGTANIDVGSVDGHYEFDPATPTPSASTPTGITRDEFQMLDPSHFSTLGGISSGYFGARKPRISRYDNIEARVQAMKEEFYAYRKRQAMKRAGVNGELESMC